MNKLELLKKYREMAAHNVARYSGDASMRTPSMGCEAGWHASKAELLMLDELISERAAYVGLENEPKDQPVRLDLIEPAEEVGKNTFIVKVTAAIDMQPMIEQARAIQKAFYKLEDELVRMDACTNTPKD